METLELLRKARDLISDPERWVQSWFSVNKDGNPVVGNNGPAVRWCALGAVHHFAPDYASSMAAKAALRRSVGGPVSHVNDRQGHAAVMEMFDRTIARLELEEIPVAEPERPKAPTPGVGVEEGLTVGVG